MRAYIDKLRQALPYLPYFFDPDPAVGMMGIWFSSLAPLELLEPGGIIDVMQDSVIGQVTSTFYFVGLLADALGDDVAAVREALFARFPTEYMAIVQDLADRVES